MLKAAGIRRRLFAISKSRSDASRRSLFHRRLLCEPLEDRRLLGVLTVTSTNDSGAGSLRAAISAANAGDTIQFHQSLSGKTINLTSGGVDISKPLTIQGLGAGQLNVSAKNSLLSSVFQVDANVAASIFDLTISGGNASSYGGGIYDAGNLTVTNCALSGNTASSAGGGIYLDGSVGGKLTVTGYTFSGNDGLTWGGGIGYVGTGGKLTVTNCTFSGNGASWGSGIWAQDGTTVITNCAISGNTTGAGINSLNGAMTIIGTTISENAGGGIYNDSGNTTTIINSTLFGNGVGTYQGGGIYNAGTLIINDSTIARNSATGAGGGIYQYSGAVTLKNTVVADNSNGSSDISGAVTTDHCLIGTTAGRRFPTREEKAFLTKTLSLVGRAITAARRSLTEAKC